MPVLPIDFTKYGFTFLNSGRFTREPYDAYMVGSYIKVVFYNEYSSLFESNFIQFGTSIVDGTKEYSGYEPEVQLCPAGKKLCTLAHKYFENAANYKRSIALSWDEDPKTVQRLKEIYDLCVSFDKEYAVYKANKKSAISSIKLFGKVYDVLETIDDVKYKEAYLFKKFKDIDSIINALTNKYVSKDLYYHTAGNIDLDECHFKNAAGKLILIDTSHGDFDIEIVKAKDIQPDEVNYLDYDGFFVKDSNNQVWFIFIDND
jgi:hypothetical protein